MKRAAILMLLAIVASAFAGPTSKQIFDRLKKLEGTWEGLAMGNQPVKVTYKLTGGGSALIETQFPGTAHEMVTVYHLDKEALMLTHYCAAGNQPTMKYKPGADLNTLAFDFVKGSNMKPTDMHMHSLKLKFVDADHIVSDWTSYNNGKPGFTAHFDLKRVKA